MRGSKEENHWAHSFLQRGNSANGESEKAEDGVEGLGSQPATRNMDLGEDLISSDKNAGRALIQAHGRWPKSHC